MGNQQNAEQLHLQIVEVARSAGIIQDRSLGKVPTIFKRVVEIPDPIDVQICWFEVNQ